MTTLELIELIALAVIALGLGIYYLIKAIKNHWIKELSDTIKTAIHEAEQSGKSGEQKKAYVMNKIADKCYKLAIPYDLLKNIISRLIDKIISNFNIVKKGK